MTDTTQQTDLDRAVEAFDFLVAERGWNEVPLLLRTRDGIDPDAGAELAVRPLDGHPAEFLLGFSAPLSWRAIGVSAEGWATQYEESPLGYTVTASAGDVRHRVRAITLVDRDGATAGLLRSENGRVDHDPPGEGLVLDCLRRALGRRTSPPAVSVDLLFATLWLEAVVSVGQRTSGPIGWAEAQALHPARKLLTGEAQPSAYEVVEAARALGRVCDWAQVREQIIRGWDLGLEPRLAVWMDTGMLSRWLLDRRPAVAGLIANARRFATEATMSRIVKALTELGLPKHLLTRGGPNR